MLLNRQQLPYPFKTVPFAHQLQCWEISRDLEAYAYFMEMGAGKSKALIDTSAYLYDQDKIDSLVVIAPKGVYRNWQDSELPAHMPDHIKYRVGVWSANATAAEQKTLDDLKRKPYDVDLLVLLVNVEAFGRDLQTNRAYAFTKDFLLGHRAMVAVDESTTIKNPTATRTKAVLKLRTLAPYRRIMSGQPAVNGPLDLFSQCEFLDPEFLGYGSYYSYRAHFCNMVKIRTGNRTVQMLAKKDPYKNLDELHRTLSKFSFIVKKEDCLDLPPKVYTTRNVTLGKEQSRAYEEMRRLGVIEIERSLDPKSGHVQQPLFQGVPSFDLLQKSTLERAADSVPDPALNPEQISTASLVITQMLRLHQILCGFMVTDGKTVVPFKEPNPRMEDLMETLDETAGKSIIWATYKFNVRQIAERIAQEHGPDSVVTYYGETSVEDRRKAIARFQDPSDPARFFVSNRTGARGITLTQAGTVFYFSNDYDLDTRCQNEDRAHRIGQTKSVTYVDYVARGTQDEKIVKALRDKMDISKLITASNWREFL